jgi:hypothetical protein
MALVIALVTPRKGGPTATFLRCCARGSVGSIEGVIYGLTIQRVGNSFELRCPECTCLTGRLGLIRQDGPHIRLHCEVHPENYGEWHSEPDLEAEKMALAGRIGLT